MQQHCLVDRRESRATLLVILAVICMNGDRNETVVMVVNETRQKKANFLFHYVSAAAEFFFKFDERNRKKIQQL